MFMAALFIIVKTRKKQTKCPSINEWIRCGTHTHTHTHTHTQEYYSAIKKDEIMTFPATGIQLEVIILSEVRERQISSTTYMWNLEKKYANKFIYKTKID